MVGPTWLAGIASGSGASAIVVIRFFLLVLAAIALVYLIVVASIDPRGDFGVGIFPVIVRDARVDKLRRFDAFRAAGPAEGVVLGSSRSMLLDPRLLTRLSGERFFNFSVDNATIEDYLALHRWVRGQGARLKTLIVGLDLDALHSDDLLDPQLARNSTLATDLEGAGPSGRVGTGLRLVSAYRHVFTAGYLYDVGWSVHQRLWPEPVTEVFDADGYLFRLSPTAGVAPTLEHCLRVMLWRFKTFTHLSSRRKDLLETLVREARAGGTRVVVWLTPLPPRTRDHLQRHSRYAALLADGRAYLEFLARTQAIRTLDYSDPSPYGEQPTDWLDCEHTDETGSARIVAGLAGRAP